MEATNAFIHHPVQPTASEIVSALGRNAGLWQEIIQFCAEQGVTESEWKSVSPKYGWSLRLKRKTRTIVYLGPCADCIRVAFVLGKRAVEAAQTSDLSTQMLAVIDKAPRYAEGTGVLLLAKRKADLDAVKTLVRIKLQN
ncbi:MAG TPA: DUF3788 family protein [Terracidiphilus sp.]|jgi:hypothetical protein|nr:DUF3788 family protein [Terracidiphilus sp.]